jgi:hypothetical protein
MLFVPVKVVTNERHFRQPTPYLPVSSLIQSFDLNDRTDVYHFFWKL